MNTSRSRRCTRRSAVTTGLFAVAAAAASHPAAAQTTDPAQIRRVAEQFVAGLAPGHDSVFVTAGHLDRRLNLPACAGELTASLSAGTQVKPRTLVGVRCLSPAWSIYLPVTVETEARVLLARRPLRRGEVPQAGDFDVGTRRIPGLSSGYVTEPALLGTRRLRRSVPAGEPLPADALESLPLVRRGQQVTMVSRAAGIEVRTSAVALADAAAGERLRVRNPASGRLLEGTVLGDGTVAALP